MNPSRPEPLDTTVVVPTIGRASLRTLLDRLGAATGLRPAAVVVVDDRHGGGDLDGLLPAADALPVTAVRSGGKGPAAARNVGWRQARTTWVSFLDDDVLPGQDWFAALERDLSAVSDEVAGTQGRVQVPLPKGRRPTDWERVTAGLADAEWITADMTYRRSALSRAGGFDARFPRAFREDADLALRVQASSGRLVRGTRVVTHPVRRADDSVSLRTQAGNADDVLMRRLHGPGWHARASAIRGRRPRHVATSLAGAAAVVLATSGRPRAARLAALGWLAGTADFAIARIRPGPRDRAEIRRMLVTSVAIPPAATWHTVAGMWRHRRALPWRGTPDLVLFDRDGTLVHDVPYNGDPRAVRPVNGARELMDRLRSQGVRTGVVTNQSGIGSGLLTADQVDAVNARVERLLGPFDVWQVCRHDRDAGCDCRKPAPGMVLAACADLGVPPERCVVIGDIGSDVAAATAAGAVGMLVPTPATRREEVEAAEQVHTSLAAAVQALLDGRW